MIPQPIVIDNVGGYNTSATSIQVDDTSMVSVGDVYLNTLTPSDPEQILVVSIDTSTTITITRAHNGTTAAGINDNQALDFYSDSISLADRTVLDLIELVADNTLVDLSRQRAVGDTKEWNRLNRVCVLAAARVESILGSAGSYTTHDLTVGDLTFLDFSTRWAILSFSNVYTLTMSDKGTDGMESLRVELQQYARGLRQEASSPVIVERDNDKRNARYPDSTWDSNTDTE